MFSFLKIVIGIPLLQIPFNGLSFISAFMGLAGLYLILDGLTGTMSWLGSLSKTDSSRPHSQTPA